MASAKGEPPTFTRKEAQSSLKEHQTSHAPKENVLKKQEIPENNLNLNDIPLVKSGISHAKLITFF